MTSAAVEAKDEVSLLINGQIYKGWTGVSVKLGIRSISGGFDLMVTDDWTRGKNPWPIQPGNSCTVKVGPDTVITGYVDDVAPSYDGHSHSINVSGRDSAADLVDCSADSGDAKYKNITLLGLAKKLCAPFGISVVDNFGDTFVFPGFNIGPGESCFEVLDKAARLRGCLLYSDGKGSLVLGKPGSVLSGTALVEGQNIIKASTRFSAKERYQTYVVKSQLGGWKDGVPIATKVGIIGKATDPGITRPRRLELMAETNTDIAGAQRRANWEASTRRGKSQPVQVTVDGHRQADGTLWRPNYLAQITSRWLGLPQATSLLIAEVDYVQNGEEGTVTTLDLVPADALQVLQTQYNAKDLWANYGKAG